VRDITRIRAPDKHATDEESYAYATIGESAKSSIEGKVFILTTAPDSVKRLLEVYQTALQGCDYGFGAVADVQP
jgi:hypothetical protein